MVQSIKITVLDKMVGLLKIVQGVTLNFLKQQEQRKKCLIFCGKTSKQC